MARRARHWLDHPCRDDRHDDLGEPIVVLVDGAAHAMLGFDGAALEIESQWTSVPEADVLGRSLALQVDLVARLPQRWPSLPAADPWSIVWGRGGLPVHDRAALLAAR